MTISSEDRSTAPFAGNGAATSFPFTFKVFATSDLVVVLTDADGVDNVLVLDSDYSVTLNPDQDNNPGGTITYPIIGSPLAVGESLITYGDITYLQPADIVNQSGFYPRVIENALDRVTMLIQQVLGLARRAIRVPVSAASVNTELPDIAQRAGRLVAFDNEGNVIVSNKTLLEVEGNADIREGSRTTQQYVATAGQTSVDTIYEFVPGTDQVAVNVNGSRLVPGVDYTESDPNTITFTQLLQEGDVVLVELYGRTTSFVDAVNVGFGSRSMADKLGEWVSVKDDPFNAVGSGSVNDAAAFQAAVNSVAPGQAATILVPAGTYRLDSNVVQNSRFVTFFIMAGATLTGTGRLETNLVKYDQLGAQYGQGRHAFGSNAEGGGLLVGGGVPDEGGNGVLLSSDGHANWMRAITSINHNPTEVLIYGASGQGRAISVVGGGFIDRTEGTNFTADWVGRPFYFNYKKYEVKSFVSVNRLELQEVGGAAVVFGSAAISAFHFVMTTGAGLCSVSGTTVTRISGQPFVPFVTYPGFQFKLNGVTVTVLAFLSPDQLTLTAAPGDTASTGYFYELDINSQISTLRVQKQFGTTEENLTLSARANGEYEIRVGQAGNGEYYPLKVYNGALAAFTPQPIAVFSTNGRMGVSPSLTHTPAARLHVADVRTENISSGLYNEASRISTSWSDGARAIEIGQFSVGTQGGYFQGRDGAGNLYDLAINPRGGNVGIGLNNPVMKLTVAGVVGPGADNIYSLGQSGARWSVVWAATGTINTSDARLKTDIVESPLGLDFINALNPVAYKFKVGGNRIEEVDDGFDEIQVQATEEIEVEEEVVEVKEIEGRKVLVRRTVTRKDERPAFDVLENLYDEAGNPLPPTSVPRMTTVRIPRVKAVPRAVTGKRQHFGLLSQEVKSVLDNTGVDFGGYVEGEDGTLGLRYEEFVAPLIKAVQELSAKVAELERR